IQAMIIQRSSRLLSPSRLAVLLVAALAAVNAETTEKSRKKRFCGLQDIQGVQYAIPCAQPATCRRYETPPPRAACPPPIIIVAPGFRPELRPQSFRPHNSYIRPQSQLQPQFVQRPQPQYQQIQPQYRPVYQPQPQPYYAQQQPPQPVFQPQYQYPQEANAYVTAPAFPLPNARPLPAGVRPPISYHNVAPGGYVTAPNQFGPRPLPPGSRVGIPKPPGRNGQQGGLIGRIGPNGGHGRVITTSPRPLKKVTPSSKKIHEENEDDLLKYPKFPNELPASFFARPGDPISPTSHVKQPPRPKFMSTISPTTTGTTPGRAEINSTTPFPEKHGHIDFTSGDDGEFGAEGGRPGQIKVDVATLAPGDRFPSSTLAPFAPDGQDPSTGFSSGPRNGGAGPDREGFNGPDGEFLVPEGGPNGGRTGGDNFGSDSSFQSGGDLPDGFDNNGNRIPGGQKGNGPHRGQGSSTDRSNGGFPDNDNFPGGDNSFDHSFPGMPPLDPEFTGSSFTASPPDRTGFNEFGVSTISPPSISPLNVVRLPGSHQTSFPGGSPQPELPFIRTGFRPHPSRLGQPTDGRRIVSGSSINSRISNTDRSTGGNGGFSGSDRGGSGPSFGQHGGSPIPGSEERGGLSGPGFSGPDRGGSGPGFGPSRHGGSPNPGFEEHGPGFDGRGDHSGSGTDGRGGFPGNFNGHAPDSFTPHGKDDRPHGGRQPTGQFGGSGPGTFTPGPSSTFPGTNSENHKQIVHVSPNGSPNLFSSKNPSTTSDGRPGLPGPSVNSGF
ncbi:hypothetical protein PENTCL1PPCAC_2563, partial [Pristionchus entomophagus]